MAAIAVPAPRQVTFSAELRRMTRDDHERVEARIGLPDSLRSAGDLARLLRAWRLVWSGVHRGCGPAGNDESARLLVCAVRAIDQVAADLRALRVLDGDASGEGQPALAGMPAGLLASTPGVWAVSYVLRGSRVGGTVLAPQIAQRVHLPDGVGMSYYADPAAGRNWVGFRERLDAWGRTAGRPVRDDTVRLTREAFALVADVLADALAGVLTDDPLAGTT